MSEQRPDVKSRGRHDDVITHAMEDYLKVIYQLEQDHGKVTTQLIAERLGVQSPSVTNMIKRLADMRLLEHEPYRGVMLTPSGRRAALEVVRHHRLLELYLSEALGYPWDAVHEEADRLEHTISEEFEDRIDRVLGFPTTDPHGDPIPTREGVIEPLSTISLADAKTGDEMVIERVCDRKPDVLRYLGSLGLYPNAQVRVVERYPFDGPLRVAIGDVEHVLGADLAASIRVRRIAR